MNKDIITLLSSVLGSDRILDAPNFHACISYAQIHGLVGIVYYVLPMIPLDMQPDSKIRDFLKKAAYSSAVRNEIQDREIQEICKAFCSKAILFLPLKGFELKTLYPKPEMRYMSDTDILIEDLQADEVRLSLENLGYRTDRFGNGDTDIYTSPSGLRYEVHRSLEHEGFNAASCLFLKDILSYAVQDNTEDAMLRIPHEEHYAYILCHFVKHLLNGGIGIRQVMDIYLCRKKWVFDEEKLAKLLAELELTEFAATIEKLANHWFGDGEGDSVTEELGEYILGSGVFGKDEQKVADRMLKEEKKQGKFSYVWSRLFPSYKTMCFYYPVLKKWSILLPVFWVWRMIYALIFRRDKLKREVTTVSETDREAVRQRAAFYQRCGLNVYSEYAEKS